MDREELRQAAMLEELRRLTRAQQAANKINLLRLMHDMGLGGDLDQQVADVAVIVLGKGPRK